jgi:hypothetical protein
MTARKAKAGTRTDGKARAGTRTDGKARAGTRTARKARAGTRTDGKARTITARTASATQEQEKRDGLWGDLVLAVTLFACGDGNGQAILVWRQRAGGVGGVAAGRVVGVVEVDDEGAGLVDAVGGEGGGEEAARAVGGGAAGGVAEVEEEGVTFEEGIEADGLTVEGELGVAGGWLVGGLAENVEDMDGLGWSVGDLLSRDAECGVGGVPVEAVEADAGGSVGVLDPEVEAVAAVNDGDEDVASGDLGGVGRVVGVEEAAGGGLAVEEDGGVGALGGSEVLDAAIVLAEDAEMGWGVEELELVVRGRAYRGVAVGEPLQRDEGEPAVGLG